jgi:uncharacterized protein
MVDLAASYETGTGAPKDENRAQQYYRRAEALGNSDAAEGLGDMYWSGEAGGRPDYFTALRWYRKAADLGDNRALVDIGDAFYYGRGVPEKNYATAVSWYQRAADAGNSSGLFNLGYMYRWGVGVTEDVPRALHLYREAAEGGSSAAQDALATEYESGSVVRKNARLAEAWYERAADAGYADAEWHLGKMLSGATGEPPDYVASAKWLSLAAASTSDSETLSSSSKLLGEVIARLPADAKADVEFELHEWALRHGLKLSFGRSSEMPNIRQFIRAIAQATRAQHNSVSLEKVVK